MSITIQNLNKKRFGNFHALKNINLNVPAGKLVSLLGPSGCGKTTLLRIIAGLENADGGQILFDGQDVTAKHVRERKVGFVFQHYALFRHMNVFDNVAFGLTVLPKPERPSKGQIRAKVEELLKLVQLSHLAKSYPHQLSGGQRQRIALARALAVEPKLLLLDEPFGALDAKVRKELRTWLRDIHHNLGVTSILVTHDQEEALEVSDEIVVMNHGKSNKPAVPKPFTANPKTPSLPSSSAKPTHLKDASKKGSGITTASRGNWTRNTNGRSKPPPAISARTNGRSPPNTKPR